MLLGRRGLQLRQWNRPVVEAIVSKKSRAEEESQVQASDVPDDPLPKGWRQSLDKTTGRVYYINE